MHAVAKDSAGRTAAEDSSFTTLTPKNTFVGTFTPEDGSKVGVGMPFSLRFTRGITHPEDVEKAIRITTEPAVEVEGTWFGNDRPTSAPRSTGSPAPRSPSTSTSTASRAAPASTASRPRPSPSPSAAARSPSSTPRSTP
ncbi:hypothetical protein SHIRM173S_02659 [Streptomyces hirsutus]